MDGTERIGGPTSVSLADLTTGNGGRVPVGIDVRRAPGPYTAGWGETTTTTVVARGGVLLDARQVGTRLVTISGGGLTTPRTLSVAGADDWAATDEAVAAASSSVAQATEETRLWGLQVPIALALGAVVLIAVALRSLLRTRGDDAAGALTIATRARPTTQNRTSRYAIH